MHRLRYISEAPPLSAPVMHIFVVDARGHKLPLTVSSDTTVREVRAKIATERRLMYDGGVLQDQRRIESHNIIEGATLPLLTSKMWFTQRGNLDGRVPLHLAIQANRQEAARLLCNVDGGAAVTRACKSIKYTALHYAVNREESSNLVQLLLAQWPAAAACRDKSGWTPLHVAAAAGHSEFVELLATAFPDGVKGKQDDGFTPLHLAAFHGRVRVVQVLLSKWADGVRATDMVGQTPLHRAASGGRLDVVWLLVSAWPEGVRRRDLMGRTPYQVAIDFSRANVGAFLVSFE